jgi:hypothetical protein
MVADGACIAQQLLVCPRPGPPEEEEEEEEEDTT